MKRLALALFAVWFVWITLHIASQVYGQDIGPVLKRIDLAIEKYEQHPAGVDFSWSPAAAHHMAAVRINANGGCGSGTFVNMGGPCLVVTCAHVVGGATEARVTFRNGKSGVGKCYRDREGHDLAIVVIQDPDSPALPLAKTPPQIGEWIELTGFAHSGYENSTGDGNYILRHWYGRVKQNTLRHQAEYDAGIAAGDSGGGVINMRGEFCGVITEGTTLPDFDNDYRHRTHHQAAGPSLEHIHRMANTLCKTFNNSQLFPPQSGRGYT